MVRKSYTLLHFILSYNQLFELYNLCLEDHCIRYELRFFMAKEFSLLKLINHYDQHGLWSTIFKDFNMTLTRIRDLPIQFRVCYYWAKSAEFFLWKRDDKEQ